MERKQIIIKLNEIFEDIIDEGSVSLSETSTSKDVEGWDSLTNIQLVVAIEKKYKIRFTSDEIMSWKNIGMMIDDILSKLVCLNNIE
ncbi:MAG: acyl carrier protein [Paludibacter sp.]|nr:acyl carrier protein [Paludibacter sp.]